MNQNLPVPNTARQTAWVAEHVRQACVGDKKKTEVKATAKAVKQ